MQGQSQDSVPSPKASAGLHEEKDTASPCSSSLPWQNLCLSFPYHLLGSEALCWQLVLLLFREAAVGMFTFTPMAHLGHCLKGG